MAIQHRVVSAYVQVRKSTKGHVKNQWPIKVSRIKFAADLRTLDLPTIWSRSSPGREGFGCQAAGSYAILFLAVRSLGC